MNTGFQKLQISDPNKLKSFIEGTTGSILAILTVSYIIFHHRATKDEIVKTA